MNLPEKTIIFEDDDILVLNKPPGLVVNRAESVKEDSLQDWLDEYLDLSKLERTAENQLLLSRSGLAHRLDKDTSGCLLVGKNPESLSKLLAQFKARQVEKSYIALVHRRLEPKQGTIKLPIGREVVSRQKWRVHYLGKIAETSWEVQEYFDRAGETLTLVKLFPKTGRTHQIRVHLSHLGHPLVADSRYLSDKRAKLDREILGRHFLHASSLVISHPRTGKRLEFSAPLAADLKAVLKQLKQPD